MHFLQPQLMAALLPRQLQQQAKQPLPMLVEHQSVSRCWTNQSPLSQRGTSPSTGMEMSKNQPQQAQLTAQLTVPTLELLPVKSLVPPLPVLLQLREPKPARSSERAE